MLSIECLGKVPIQSIPFQVRDQSRIFRPIGTTIQEAKPKISILKCHHTTSAYFCQRLKSLLNNVNNE